MKTTMKTTAALLGLATLAFLATANAGTTTSNPTNDLMLGFRAISGTGTGINLEVDLGSLPSIISGPFSININADLTADYGSNWNTRTDLFWSVTSQNGETGLDTFPDDTLYATAKGLGSVKPGLAGAQQTAVQNIGTFESGFAGHTMGALSNSANVTSSEAVSYSSTITAGGSKPFGFFNQPIENNTNTTGGSVVANFERLVPTDAGGNANGTLLGTFTLDSAGDFVFAPAAVPEPSTWAMLAMGSGQLTAFLIFKRRRKHA